MRGRNAGHHWPRQHPTSRHNPNGMWLASAVQSEIHPSRHQSVRGIDHQPVAPTRAGPSNHNISQRRLNQLSKNNGRYTGLREEGTTAAEAAAKVGITKEQAVAALLELHNERLAEEAQNSVPPEDAG